MKIKKPSRFVVFIFLLLLIMVLAGCGGNKKKKPNAPDIVTFDPITNSTKIVRQRECDIRKKEWDNINPAGLIKCDDGTFSKSECTIKTANSVYYSIHYNLHCEITTLKSGEIQTGKITELPSDKFNKTSLDIAEEKKTCESKGGINCEGCCKSPIFSSNVFTCCEPKGCIERTQFQASNKFGKLENVTIEKFPKGNYGVWYGGKDKDFGVRKYADATLIKDNIYKFIAEEKEYQFTTINSGCDISIDSESILIKNESLNSTETFGSLFVESEPTNSSVYLDGASRGLTPILVADLTVGTYEVRVSKEGYKDSSAFWSINSGETKNLSIRLKQ